MTPTGWPAPRSSTAAEDVWARAGLVCKVKEPQASELPLLREDLTLFTYLHLAAYPAVADALVAAGTTGVAYETVMRPDGLLPLLAPMSEIAGRMAVQAGARFLEAPQGGRGVLLSGAPGVRPARVSVIGAGNVGWNAAMIAAGMGAEVTLLDRNIERLRALEPTLPGRITTLASNRGSVERSVAESDLVVGAVLLPGGRAPTVVSESMVAGMRPGSVIADVAIDQGGCIETARETSHQDPVYEVHGVLHYCVGQHPRGGAGHVDLGAHQRHAAVPGRTGDAGCGRGLPSRPGAGPRAQHRGRRRGQRRGGRLARHGRRYRPPPRSVTR